MDKVSFKSRFLDTPSMHEMVKYTQQHPAQFQKLNAARKILEEYDTFTKLALNVGTGENGKPFVEITRYKPVYELKNGEIQTLYDVKTTRKEVEKNPLKAAYELILKCSRSAPENNAYKQIIK